MRHAHSFTVAASVWVLSCGAGPAPAPPTSSPGGTAPPAAPAAPSAPEVKPEHVQVLFKFDPGATYGGVRWLPAPYSSGLRGGTEATVEVRVEGTDAQQRPVKLQPRWTAAEPAMVVVTPVLDGQLDHVLLTVKSAGTSAVTVAGPGFTRALSVTATQVMSNAMKVEISEGGQ